MQRQPAHPVAAAPPSRSASISDGKLLKLTGGGPHCDFAPRPRRFDGVADVGVAASGNGDAAEGARLSPAWLPWTSPSASPSHKSHLVSEGLGGWSIEKQRENSCDGRQLWGAPDGIAATTWNAACRTTFGIATPHGVGADHGVVEAPCMAAIQGGRRRAPTV